jgi:hypothetical protein
LSVNPVSREHAPVPSDQALETLQSVGKRRRGRPQLGLDLGDALEDRAFPEAGAHFDR